MRADRLIAVLLILQNKGRVTAGELASELEISPRTARRDLEALAMAGVPVYSQPGKGGGWSLVGRARTDLSGLTADEARTLFLIAGPSSTATPEVKAALRKLVRALPETFRADAEKAAAAVVIDASTWDRDPVRRPEFLDVLQKAVVDAKVVRLGYGWSEGDAVASERLVHPLGLVSKGTKWYLVAGTDAGQRTFRVDRVRSVEPTDEPAHRPDGFDLAAAWAEVMENLDAQRIPFRAIARVTPEMLTWLKGDFGKRLTVLRELEDGRVEVELRGHSAEMIAREIAGAGANIEIVEPEDVKTWLARIGEELTRRYVSGGRRTQAQ